MQISNIEYELKKVSQMPKWGRKQSDDWDKLSCFVYDFPTFEKLQEKLKSLNLSQEFNDYTLHRWFNTLSADGVEKIFADNPQVVKNTVRQDKLVDFTIQGISFDHKTTVFPRGFGKDIYYAKQNPRELIEWLYTEQSRQGRFHTANRLFIVLHSADSQHWKLRAELTLLKPIISQYIQEFDVHKLHRFSFEKNKETLADIIWFCK